MIQRNDACWCGSGRKYKKCHMNADRDRSAPSRRSGARAATARMIKTPEAIDGMRKAGRFNGELMDYMRPHVREGVSTLALDRLAHEYTVGHGHTPACLGYNGFTRSICVSINNIVCHGIPSENEILRAGDIVNIDLTTIVDGYHGDSSEMFMIGDVSDEAHALVVVTARALLRGIDAVKPGLPLSAIAGAIEPFVAEHGCSVVHQYTGHGIGALFHEYYSVFHHRARDFDDIVMTPGMTFTIEPMVNRGGWKVETDKKDKWTVRTIDGSLSAQFEHTIAVTGSGAQILTLTPRQIANGVPLIVDGVGGDELLGPADDPPAGNGPAVVGERAAP